MFLDYLYEIIVGFLVTAILPQQSIETIVIERIV